MALDPLNWEFYLGFCFFLLMKFQNFDEIFKISSAHNNNTYSSPIIHFKDLVLLKDDIIVISGGKDSHVYEYLKTNNQVLKKSLPKNKISLKLL